MKATGIVRRIDELGRIVVPKEIRKSLRIKEGDNLEIFVDKEENIILKKYSQIKKLEDFAQNLTDSIQSNIKHTVLITDNDSVIAVSGPLKKDYHQKPISEEIELKIKRREEMLERHSKKIKIISEADAIEATYAISPIIVNGDCHGLVMVISKDTIITEEEMKIAQVASGFLKNNLE